jgi:hypothetical protein
MALLGLLLYGLAVLVAGGPALAIKTACAHCKPGGTALFQPDDLRETFKPGRERGGHAHDGRKLRYVETSRGLSRDMLRVGVTFTITLTDRDGARS